MNEQMTLAEVLRKGADHMERHGWMREDYGDSQGQVCMLGACVVALGYDPMEFSESDITADSLFYEAAEVLLEALELREVEVSAVEAVGEWNDEYCPGQEYAVALLRAAAERVS